MVYNVGLHIIIVIFLQLYLIVRSVNIAMSYRLNAQKVRIQFLAGTRNFSFLQCPGQLCAILSLLLNVYSGLFHQGQNNWDMKHTTHLGLMLRLRICGYIHPLLYNIHGFVLKWLNTGANLLLLFVLIYSLLKLRLFL
jgi:hypothetical protein